MHLLYADESGSIRDAGQEYFVLAGFSVFERQGYWLSNELDKIAARFNPGEPESVELHGSPMLQGRKFWRGFPVAQRIEAMKDALRVLNNSHRSNRVFGVAIRKEAVSPEDPIEYAFEQLASRFDQYLGRLHKRGDTQRGIIVLDKMTYESTLQGLTAMFRATGHRWGKLHNFAEVPLFLDSRASRLVQLADIIAYGLFRHVEKQDSQFYELIAKRFDSDGGVVHGLYQMP